jgi:hypothetical protein
MSSDAQERVRQPPTEAALGTPVQIREDGNVTIVGIRTAEGWRELKRIRE